MKKRLRLLFTLGLSHFLVILALLINPVHIQAATCDNQTAERCTAGGTQVTGSTQCGIPNTGTPIWCCPEGTTLNASNRTCVNPLPPRCQNPGPLQCLSGSPVTGAVNCSSERSGTSVWCCADGYRADSQTRSCIPDELPSACQGTTAGQCTTSGAVSGATQCNAPGSAVQFWCCPTGYSIDSAANRCVSSDPDDGSGIVVPPGTAPTSETFKNLNPLIIGSEDGSNPDRNSILAAFLGVDYTSPSPAGFINRALTFAFPIAGLILFIMIVWGGFEMLSGATSKKSIDQGRQRITAALIGFVLLFTAYWIIKVVEAMFGVAIL